MNKLIIISIFILFAICSKSWAEEDFKSIESILDEAIWDEPTLVYAFHRCSALFISLVHRKDEIDNEEIKNFNKIGEKFYGFATQLIKKFNFQLSEDDQMNTIFNIALLYKKKWESNYEKFGKYIGTMTREDKILCESFLFLAGNFLLLKESFQKSGICLQQPLLMLPLN